MHACDGQTDRLTEFSSLDRVCIACSAVKTGKHGIPVESYRLLLRTPDCAECTPDVFLMRRDWNHMHYLHHTTLSRSRICSSISRHDAERMLLLLRPAMMDTAREVFERERAIRTDSVFFSLSLK